MTTTKANATPDFSQAWSDLIGGWTQHATPAGGDDPQFQWTLLLKVMESYRQLADATVLEHPGQMIDQQIDFWRQHMAICQSTMMRMAGQETRAVIKPEKGDRRFEAPEWKESPWFDYLHQTYLLVNKSVKQAVDDVPGLDEKTHQRVRFFTRQLLSAMSPGNFLLSNPEVLRLTMESGGSNLLRGMQQFSEDMKNSADCLNVRMTDRSTFRLGENLATTPGKVVYRNAMFELIQYLPNTASVYKRPLLIVPPWINKFYVLDLRADNSFARFARDQGHTVFMISWANPGRASRMTGIDEYVTHAMLAALDAIRDLTGEPDANVMGYCAGGILLAITLAWLAARGESSRIASATHLTSLFDFSDAGDIGVYLDDFIVKALEQELDRQGVLDGRMLAVTFSMLRENDLYWNYFIQNYLKGERPIPFDMLFWNTDSTNVPASIHKFFLRQLYLDNLLREPGGVSVTGTPIDLQQVTTPAFILATQQDHIAKWQGCYAGTQLYRGPVEFILGESGHVAGVLNPPQGRYGHYRHTSLPSSAQTWFAEATLYPESWWLAWQRWIDPWVGDQVPARSPQKDLGDAPGSYVLVSATQALMGEP